MALTFRTISDLPLLEELDDGSLFNVSVPGGETGGTQTYTSMKVTFGSLRDAAISASILSTESILQIPEGTSLKKDVLDPISGLLSGEAVLSGQKSFFERPTVLSSGTDELSGNSLVTKDDVEGMIVDTAFCFSPDGKATASPNNSAGYTTDDGNLLMWNIDSGQRDSSLFIDGEGHRAGYVTCPESGMLVAYGWLADNGNLNPENCWAGLFSPIENADGTVKDILVQVQPWIIGDKSQTLQYVGFTLPVRKGLKLKLMTGFNVNGNNSGFGNQNSLMTAKVGSMVNTLIGYIIT